MGNEKSKEILIARIDILTDNLSRVLNLLDDDILGPKGKKIRGKFSAVIGPLSRNLELLRRRIMEIEEGNAGEKGIAEAWNQLDQYSLSANQIHSQCLDFLGGQAAQRWNLEEGVCALSEKLVEQIAKGVGVTWDSAMILGEERPIDDIAAATQIIRIRFPEWDIWSLPFIAYEYGQICARSDDIDQFKRLFERKMKQVTEFIEKEKGIDSTHWVEELTKAREKYQAAIAEAKTKPNEETVAEKVHEQMEDFRNMILAHLRSLFADILATFFMGPAYLYARTYLRLVPEHVDDTMPSQPALERRIAYIFETLKHMNEAAKPERNANGVYDGEISRFEELWSKTVTRELPNTNKLMGQKNDLNYKEPYNSWFDDCFDTLSSVCFHQGFEGKHWKSAEILAERIEQKLPDSVELTKEDTLPVIMNAAWIFRRKAPDKVHEISNSTYKLCKTLTQVQPSEMESDKLKKTKAPSQQRIRKTK